MKYQLSVGYNGNFEDLERIISASDKVKDIYTGGLHKKLAGGRYQYANSLDNLCKSVEYAHSRNVTVSVTLNAPAGIKTKEDTLWWNEIKEYLKDLESAGVDKIIIAHPFLISLAKETTGMLVIASTVCEIMNARSAIYYENMGADIIVPSSSANMNIDELRLMKNSLKHASLKILVNEACLGNCPWRRFHQVHLSNADKKGFDIDYSNSCTNVYKENPYLILTNNAIRPEDLKKYEGICDNFKLIGRTTEISVLEKMIKAYGNESFDGNFVELIDYEFSKIISIDNKKIEGLVDIKFKCDKNCSNCSYCKTVYEDSKAVTAG